MKTLVPFKLLVVGLLIYGNSFSQTNQGLVFKNPTLLTASSTDLKAGAIYLFKGVKPQINATVKIDSLVNGIKVNKIDDNTGGLGYLDAFQPELKIPAGTGTSYAVFTVNFQDSLTGLAQVMNSVQGTALDIDGNLNLKEMVDIDMGGGTATFASTGLDISVLQILVTRFRALNILGIERSGIDTSATGNMYTVTKANISSFTVRLGALTVAAGSTDRQFSLYMKGFNYSNAQSLPVKLVSFTATLNNASTKANLAWITATEINVSHFSIERSTDGVNFTQAAIVFAYGNSTDDKTYSYSEDISNVQSNIIYYRLRSVDIDGKSTVSAVRVIRVEKQADQFKMAVYPNPASNELRLTLPASWQNKPVSIDVFNQSGQQVRSIRETQASQTETINVEGLPPGFYVVKAISASEQAQQKFVKN